MTLNKRLTRCMFPSVSPKTRWPWPLVATLTLASWKVCCQHSTGKVANIHKNNDFCFKKSSWFSDLSLMPLLLTLHFDVDVCNHISNLKRVFFSHLDPFLYLQQLQILWQYRLNQVILVIYNCYVVFNVIRINKNVISWQVSH